MSFNTRPISLTYATKVEVTVANSAGTSQLLGQLSGPIQVRIVNNDTVRVAFRAGTQAFANAITLSNSPTFPGGATEIITIHPNPDNTPVYWNIFGDTAPGGKAFEVTICSGI